MAVNGRCCIHPERGQWQHCGGWHEAEIGKKIFNRRAGQNGVSHSREIAMARIPILVTIEGLHSPTKVPIRLHWRNLLHSLRLQRELTGKQKKAPTGRRTQIVINICDPPILLTVRAELSTHTCALKFFPSGCLVPTPKQL